MDNWKSRPGLHPQKILLKVIHPNQEQTQKDHKETENDHNNSKEI